MNDAQKQALMRFVAGLIAEVVGIATAALASPEFGQLVGEFFGGDALLTGLILAAVPPIVLALGKLVDGPTEKAGSDGTRGARRIAGKSPGLFG